MTQRRRIICYKFALVSLLAKLGIPEDVRRVVMDYIDPHLTFCSSVFNLWCLLADNHKLFEHDLLLCGLSGGVYKISTVPERGIITKHQLCALSPGTWCVQVSRGWRIICYATIVGVFDNEVVVVRVGYDNTPEITTISIEIARKYLLLFSIELVDHLHACGMRVNKREE